MHRENLDFEIVSSIFDSVILQKEDLFVTIEKSGLVSLVKRIRDKNFVLRKGNDIPLKELLEVTVICTGFKLMGETATEIIKKKKD